MLTTDTGVARGNGGPLWAIRAVALVAVIVLAQLPAAHDAAAQSGDRCLTAADQAEISRLEKEIAGLREQRKALDAQYSRDSTRYEEARERDKREGWPAGQGSSATHAAYKAWTTSLDKLGAADKAIAADEQKLAALRALPPCAPGKPAQPVTTPAPVPPTGTPAPVPPTGTPTVTTETPCPPDPREAQLQKELAEIDVQLKRLNIALDSDNEAVRRRERQLQKLLSFPPSILEGKGSIKDRDPWLAALREDETYQRLLEVRKRDYENFERLNKKHIQLFGELINLIEKRKKSCPPSPPKSPPPPPTVPGAVPLPPSVAPEHSMAPLLTPPDGLYAGAKAGWTHLGTLDAVTHFEDGGTATDRDHHDEGFDVGGRLGVKQGPWRFEGEFNYRRNGLSEIVSTSDPKASGSTQAFTFLGNAIYDFDVSPWWGGMTPHIGAGIGLAHLSAKQKIAGFTLLDSSDTQFAYQAIAGLRFPLTPNWALDLDYRYLAATDPTYKSPAGARVTSSYQTHNVIASLTFSFAPPPLPPVLPAALPAPQRQLFLVFFDWDRDTITPDGMRLIQQAAAAYRAGGYVQLIVTGYTDRSGSPGYNQRLSERRANNVAAALAGLGVPRTQMAVTGRGDNDNRVPTAAGVREPQNRRVEIVF